MLADDGAERAGQRHPAGPSVALRAVSQRRGKADRQWIRPSDGR
jgi:hypothetical protein